MRRTTTEKSENRIIRKAVTAGLVAATAGCSMPQSMQVRSGTDPRYSDDDVRFRATLYLRVFQICQNSDDATDFRLATGRRDQDSLYRFRMTGKANALGNEVQFESGTLRSDEIDGFGRTVRIEKAKQDGAGNADALPAAADVARIETKIDKLAASIDTFKRRKPEGDIAAASTGFSSTASSPCPSGYQVKQKFALRGPEGWRILDQDERLVLAMSSSAKPLVTSLRSLAALRAAPTQVAGRELIEEENRVLEILLKVTDEKLVEKRDAPRKALEWLQEEKYGQPAATAAKESPLSGTPVEGAAGNPVPPNLPDGSQ